MKQVFSGGGGVIYAVNNQNLLLWYRHLGYADGTDRWQTTPDPKGHIGEGWDMKHVFSGGDGVIYAVNNQNQLLWYRHLGFADGTDRWQTTPDPKGHIGEGWDMKHVFAGGNGVIYAVNNLNQLLWYRHLGFADGTDRWQTTPETKGYIGEEWDFQQLFCAGNGVIYAVDSQEHLLWYRHLGFATGVETWERTPDPKGYIGEGWNMNWAFAGDLNVPIVPLAPAGLQPGDGWNVNADSVYLSYRDAGIGTTAQGSQSHYSLTDLQNGDGIGSLSPGSPVIPPGIKQGGLIPGSKYTLKAWWENEVGTGPAASVTFTVLPASAPAPPAPTPPQTKPTISVTSSGAGNSSAFVVTGQGFSASKAVTIRVVDDQLVTDNFHQNSDAAGKLTAKIPLPCRSGFALHFSATDGRSDPSDVTGSLWSNTVTTNCP